jgi:hypothetical protein
VLSWADRILALCHAGDFVAAIDLTARYYDSTALGNTIGLPVTPKAQHELLRARALSLMRASLKYAFSEDRLTDGTYDSTDGRGVDLTPLFEGLVECCFQACMTIEEPAFLFEEVFEAYANVGIEGIFLRILAKHLLEDRVVDIPPQIIQALLAYHARRGEYEQAERIIWHVDPQRLDINQSIVLCETHGLWDAYIYVHNQCLMDYTTPLAKILDMIQETRQNDPDKSTATSDLVSQHATRLYRYIECTLSGNVHPSGQPANYRAAEEGRKAMYGCLFSLTAPPDPAFAPLRNHDAYPVLQSLLHLDTEATLHTLDVAFEDGYLNDNHGFLMSRQLIVNILLEVMSPQQYHAGDITLLHIFIARNLPKYPQFVLVSPSTLHQILQGLASDPDLSTREDRELAAEFLLSAYTPYDTDAIYRQFREAGFWRILRSVYTKDQDWVEALKVDIADDSLLSDEYFSEINGVLMAGLKSNQAVKLKAEIKASLAELLEASITATAATLEKHLPDLHPDALSRLEGQRQKQRNYLAVLIEPYPIIEIDEKTDHRPTVQAAPSVTDDMYVAYLSLLCEFDSDRIIPFIESHSRLLAIPHVEAVLESQSMFHALVWYIFLRGDQQRAFAKLGHVMHALASQLLHGADSSSDNASTLAHIEKVARTGMQMAQHTSSIDGFSREDSWYYILSQTLAIIRRIHRTNTSDVSPETMLPTLRTVVQDELSGLLSNSGTSTVAFPKLFKRLMDQPEDETDIQVSETSAEMKIILTSMLRAYATDEELLKITNRIIGDDLHALFAELLRVKSSGWKTRYDTCTHCSISVLLSEKEVDMLNRQGSLETEQVQVAIAQDGHCTHVSCMMSSP